MQLKKKHRRAGVRSKRRCYYCGVVFTRRSQATIDHMHPTSKGGSNESENRVLACRSCNNHKDDLTVEEYRTKQINLRGEPVVFWGERI